jgi:2-oxoisovalerate dehydrogenase E1 component beta subunit
MASPVVIDLRTLLPWDAATVEASVNKTGRLIVTHEAPVTSGFGAEVVAKMSQRCFLRLESPPLRVCGLDTPFPCVLEPVYMPSRAKLVEAILQSVKF